MKVNRSGIWPSGSRPAKDNQDSRPEDEPLAVTPEQAHAAFDAEYEKWWDDCADKCRCKDGPCAGVLQGGICDTP